MRLSRTVNSVTTDFLYDGLNPIQELSGGSPVATLLIGLGIDDVISRTASGSTSTFLADGLGSTVALTDGTGAVQTEYTYDPFGAVTVTGTSSTNAFQFTGREQDGTGLFYYRARYYSPLLQRFISEDPIGFAGGDLNLYAYVFNSPTNFRDPSGLLVVGGGGSGSLAGAWGVDGAGGFLFDTSGNVGLFGYGGPSFGYQIAASYGTTVLIAPFANTIGDIQGTTFDVNFRWGNNLTFSFPTNGQLQNTVIAFDSLGGNFGVSVGAGHTRVGKLFNFFDWLRSLFRSGDSGPPGSGPPGSRK
ncbi:MAG: RHS repeat-associated core domain-containing protein [Nitrospirales bacterium]